MENNTLSTKKFNHVIMQLSQEMHYHVHRCKNPQLYSKGELDDVTLANISQESEALASEYSDAISLLTSVNNTISEVKELYQKLQEEQVLEDQNSGEINQEPNTQNS